MKHIFDAVRQKAQEKILSTSDRELFADNFENFVYDQKRIQTPYLDKDKTSVTIDKEVIGFGGNAPEGVSFTPGQEMEFALCSVPIVGSMDLFGEIFRGHHWNRNHFVKGLTFYYKEVSPQRITNNDTVINEIKEKAKVAIEGIQNQLEQFGQSADKFNETELKPFITHTIEQERKRRKDKGDSESKLRPF